MPKGFVYILECSDGTLYTGSTIDLELRVNQHEIVKGANHTEKRLPVKLIFAQEFPRIDEAFYREKQIQGWSRKKKLALIEEDFNSLKKHSECKNDSHHKNVASTPLSHQKPDDTLVAERSRSYSHGKLLLTGEYVVLDGALALALPTKFGQSLNVNPIEESKIIWKSYDENGKVWFEDSLTIEEIASVSSNPRNDVSKRLLQILKVAQQLNPQFLSDNKGFEVTNELEFPNFWGLGTSSTLINNIANWAKVDAYKLLELTFGGSGYDIACAQNSSAITYQLNNNEMLRQAQHDSKKRFINEVNFNPKFSDNLFFIHLNKKQDSRKGIAKYEANKSDTQTSIYEINSLTNQIINCNSLNEFESLITAHETIISKLIKLKPIKEDLFPDYKGAIKSLGAWGGDFILVTGTPSDMSYFKNKNYNTILNYKDMVK